MPVLTLWYGVTRRTVVIIRVGVVLGLITLATNKQFLRWPVHPWDPVLLGVVLISTALGVRNWLLRGAGGMRGGFTPDRILHSDLNLLQMASLASAAIHLEAQRPIPERGPELFDGGRSGGGGGGDAF